MRKASAKYEADRSNVLTECRKAEDEIKQVLNPRDGAKASGELKGIRNEVEQTNQSVRGTAPSGRPAPRTREAERERNIGIDEEHSKVGKGTGGQGAGRP